MKSTNKIIKKVLLICFAGLLVGCNDFLDQEPTSAIPPERYLNEESQLEAYANGLYADILPSHGNWSYGTFGNDAHTDNQVGMNYSSIYIPGEHKVGQSGGYWWFGNIFKCNYFLERALPSHESGEVAGSKEKIEHYIGEVYFLRAYEYYIRYRSLGDFPIIKNTHPDDKQILTEISKRAPRNEVARFILSDLDKAILYMDKSVELRRTRINKAAALLLKSRVALFEGTWLKYFKGTSFVPNGEGWPGSSKDYNTGYVYPSGGIDNEINYFLEVAMDAAQKASDFFTLTENTGTVQQSLSDRANPYMDMFGSEDLSKYSEVLLWREYSKSLHITHNVVVAAQHGNYGVGLSRGMVDGFLMANGLPIYANNSGYKGDDNLSNVRIARDSRLSIFLKEPGQRNVLKEASEGTHAVPIEPIPDILQGNTENGYGTGYSLRKGNSFDAAHCGNGVGYTASIVFRGAEAYLNYIEACYERKGSLDNTAREYWKALRKRSQVDPDFEKTIAATDMTKEAKNDWGAYSGGQLIDPILFNIRRERRSELMAESLRFNDLCRWRSMDQMINTPYHMEGFKIWGEMQEWYKDGAGNSKLVYGLSNPLSNVSPPERSIYYRPYEKVGGSLLLNGYKWHMAHYLNPIAIQHILITSENNEVSTSPIYQNPGWPSESNKGPIN